MTSQSKARNNSQYEDWRNTLNNEVLHSPCTPIEIPCEQLVARTLRALKMNAEKYPSKPAVIDAFNVERFLTYQQIHDQALTVAAFLQSRGFKEGDRATTVLSNCIEFPVIHLGVWSAGGVFTACSPVHKHHETVYQLQDSDTSIVFTSEALLESVLEAVQECPNVESVICIRSSSTLPKDSTIDFKDVLNFTAIEKIVQVSMDSPCMIYYSSGTTGLPKGVIHTQRTYHSNIEIIRSHFLCEVYPALGIFEVDWHQDSQIIFSGCHHVLGFGLLNWCLLTGSPVILMEELDVVHYSRLVSQFKPLYLFVTPPIFTYFAKDVVGRVALLESVQLILCCAAPLGREISDAFLAHHRNVKYIVQGYGMTETGYSHLPLLIQEGASASSGVVAANYQQKIVDLNTAMSCTRGEAGEICVKGPGVTIGYLNKRDATAQLFDSEGWLHTGDVGYMDEFGSIHIVDRLKEFINVYHTLQNLKVAPAELEGILLCNPSIRDVAIVGVSSEFGELVRAFVVKEREDLSASDVEQIIEDKLAAYKRITGGVVFVDLIPRSATGKILRRELKQIY